CALRHAWRATHPPGDHARRRHWRQNRLARKHAGDSMEMGQTMIVAGVGCRKGVLAADIKAAIVAALAETGVTASQLRLIATSAAKGSEPGVVAAASAIGVP